MSRTSVIVLLLLYVFMLERYRCAFEAETCTLRDELGPRGQDTDQFIDGQKRQQMMAQAYRTIWNKIRMMPDVIVRTVADDIDAKRYIYQDVSLHPRTFGDSR